ncbi:MAG: ATP-binding protein [Vicinamibacterales bacterium]
MKTLVSWSSGKDSAWMVHVLKRTPGVELGALLTTVNEAVDRVAMHAVRVELLEAQAASLGLPLRTIRIPSPCPNDVYARIMGAAVAEAVRDGFTHAAFGDLFLEDIRAYRERQLAGSGLEPLFPLFGADTRQLGRSMIAAGLKARLTCVDPRALDPRFVGREYDAALLDELPASVDPCGERGEFHSFAYDGPMFRASIPVVAGEVVERGGFHFCDLLPAGPLTSGAADHGQREAEGRAAAGPSRTER